MKKGNIKFLIFNGLLMLIISGCSFGNDNSTSDIGSSSLSSGNESITSSITFDMQGGSGGTDRITATYGEPMPNATAPTRLGHIFEGYFDAITGGTQYYNANMDSAKIWDKTDDAILYAHWIYDENYAGTDGLMFSCNESICLVSDYKGDANTVIIPMWHNERKVTGIDNSAFFNCSRLTNIIIPSSVICIGERAFAFCSGIINIIIPSSLTNISYGAFAFCSSIISITIPSSATSIGDFVFYGWTSSQTIYIQGKEFAPETWSIYWNSNCFANIVWNT